MERRDFLKISAITTGAVLTINPLSALAETMVSEEIEHRPWKLPVSELGELCLLLVIAAVCQYKMAVGYV